MQAQSQFGVPERLPLLLLPGTLCDARIFAPLLQRLGDYPVTVLPTLESKSLKDAAKAVLAAAPERFYILGFSLGGMVAMEVALLAPARVCGLALVSTTPLPVPPDRHDARRSLVEIAHSLPMPRFVRDWLWPQYGGTPGNLSTLPLLERMAEDLGAEAYAGQTEMALGRSDFRPRLATLRCPTLILAGTEDVLCPPETQLQLARALPHSTLTMLPNTGHFALVEAPDEVATAVAGWLHTTHNAVHAEADPAHREYQLDPAGSI